MADFEPPFQVIKHTANNKRKVSESRCGRFHLTTNMCSVLQDSKFLKLIFHLPDQQHAIFNETHDHQNVTRGCDPTATMFTKWMQANKNFTEARELTYPQFPTRFVWNSSKKEWTKRKKCHIIGRIVHIHPAAGEIYYLRMLFNFVKGPKSFEDIRTVNNMVLPTFKEACYERGLLDEDDKECHAAMKEASKWATTSQLKQLNAICNLELFKARYTTFTVSRIVNERFDDTLNSVEQEEESGRNKGGVRNKKQYLKRMKKEDNTFSPEEKKASTSRGKRTKYNP